MRLLERVKADLEEHGTVEQWPKLEGRQMVMVLAPKKTAAKTAAKKVTKEKAPKASKEPKAPKETKAKAAEEKTPVASGEKTAS